MKQEGAQVDGTSMCASPTRSYEAWMEACSSGLGGPGPQPDPEVPVKSSAEWGDQALCSGWEPHLDGPRRSWGKAICKTVHELSLP